MTTATWITLGILIVGIASLAFAIWKYAIQKRAKILF